MDDDLIILFSEDDYADDMAEIVALSDSRGGVTNFNQAPLPDSSFEQFQHFDEPYEELPVEIGQFDSAGVGPNRPLNPLLNVEDAWDWFDEPYELPEEWLDTPFTQSDNNPRLAPQVEHDFLHFDEPYDESVEWLIDDYQLTDRLTSPQSPAEDAWDWDEVCDDEWLTDDCQSISLVAIASPPYDDAWDWEEQLDDEFECAERYGAFTAYTDVRDDPWDWHEEIDDDWQADDVTRQSPAGALPLDDGWDWDDAPEDEWHVDDVMRQSFAVALPLEDAWDWDEPIDEDSLGFDWMSAVAPIGLDQSGDAWLIDQRLNVSLVLRRNIVGLVDARPPVMFVRKR